MPQYRHIAEMHDKGYTIDYRASGRPLAYKGPRFAPTEMALCYTELETALIKGFDEAIEACKNVDEPLDSTACGTVTADVVRKIRNRVLNEAIG